MPTKITFIRKQDFSSIFIRHFFTIFELILKTVSLSLIWHIVGPNSKPIPIAVTNQNNAEFGCAKSVCCRASGERNAVLLLPLCAFVSFIGWQWSDSNEMGSVCV